MLGASVTGSRHAKNGLPCQDAHGWKALPNGTLIAAVTDGAGSSTLGGLGSVLAVEVALRSLAEQAATDEPTDAPVWQQRLRSSLLESQRALVTKAAQLNVKPRELATTLIVLAATPEVLAVAQIGDGAVVFSDTEGALYALTTPRLRRGEYANETTFLTAPQALSAAQAAVWEGRAAQIAILSDGLQRLALRMPAGTPHGPFFAPLFQFAATHEEAETGETAQDHLRAFLGSPRVIARTDDDLTLLLATRTVEGDQ